MYEVHNLLYAYYLEKTYPVVDISSLLQAELSNRDARTADLQENVKSQQAEAVKAKEELTNALTAMEKLKETFNKERADWETEKAGLTKRAEDAEAALKPVVDELTGLKRQINAMTSAIFGKYLLMQFVQFMKPYHLPECWF